MRTAWGAHSLGRSPTISHWVSSAHWPNLAVACGRQARAGGCVMAWRGVRHGPIAAMACLLAVGCTQTSRVDDNLSTAALVRDAQGRGGDARGRGEPVLHQRGGAARRARRRGLPPPPGHHRHERALAHRAGGGRGGARSRRIPRAGLSLPDRDAASRRWPTGADRGTYRTSYASFTLQPGEIVNVGYLHFNASRRGPLVVRPADRGRRRGYRLAARRARPLQGQAAAHLCADEDAPDEGDAAGAGRPPARSAPGSRRCKAEGKVQQLPAECPAPAAARRTPAAVAKSGGNE